MAAMDSTFLKARIEKTKQMIICYEDAILALSNGVQEYTLDTGQSRTTVRKINLTTLNNTLNGMYNRLATQEARLNGSGTVTGIPGW